MPMQFFRTKCRAARLLLLMIVLGTFSASLFAQQFTEPEGTEQYADMLPFPTDRITVPSWRFTDGPHVRAAFRDVVASVREATVRVRADGKKTAMGAVVSADGWVLTKASRLQGAITCELADGRELAARLVGVSREYDVAMLKVEAQGLPSVQISETEVPPVGSWLATVGLGRDPLAVGVVSVPLREIPHRPGILGVWLDERANKAIVIRVIPGSGAALAGLLAHDIIVNVDGIPTPTREQLVRTVRGFSPGDQVELEVKRGGETLEIEAMLMGDLPGRMPTRDEFQNQLGGGLSKRRFGFPSAFQHDTVVVPSDCGGPVVNLDGVVVGFNIARSGRTETYAIATAPLAKLLEELKSGDLHPISTSGEQPAREDE